MKYQNIFRRIITLLSSPAKAWEEIVHQDVHTVFMDFVYPMIGLCGLSVFLGTLFSYGWSGPESFQIAMTVCCAVAVSLFGGYFLAAYCLNQIGMRFYNMPNRLASTQQFAGYALVVFFLVQLVEGLFPNFKVLGWILQFYTVYVIWEGAPIVMKVRDSFRLSYTLVSSVLLIICPSVIRFVFDYLTKSLV